MSKKRNSPQAWTAICTRVALALLRDQSNADLSVAFLAVDGHPHRDVFRLGPLAAKCEAGDDLATLRRMKAHMDSFTAHL